MIIRLLYHSITSIFKLIFLLLIVVAAVILYFGATQMGNAQLGRLAGHFLSNKQQQIEIAPIQGLLEGNIHLDYVRVREIGNPAADWLSLADIDLTWQPSQLGLGVVHIDKLSAEQLEISALPAGNTSKSERTTLSMPTLPELPVDVVIKQLELPDIRIAEPVVGMPARLSLRADAQYPRNAENISLHTEVSRFSVESSDAITGQLKGDINYHGRQGNLRADISLQEQTESLLAAVLGLEQVDAANLEMIAEGNVDQWQGDAKLSFDAREYLDISLHHQRHDTQHKLSLSGTAQFANLLQKHLPKTINAETLLAGATTLSGDIWLTPETSHIDVEDLSASNALWQLQLKTAKIIPQARQIDLSGLRLVAQDPAKPIPLRLSLDASRAADIRSLETDLQLTTDTISIADFTLDAATFLTQDIGAENLTLSITSQPIHFYRPDVALTYALEAKKLRIPEHLHTQLAQQPVMSTLLEKPISLSGTVTFSDMQLQLPQQQLTIGEHQITTDAAVSLIEQQFTASTTATFPTQALAVDPILAQLPRFGQSVDLNLHASGSFQGHPSIDVDTLTVTLGTHRVLASGRLEDNIFDADVSANIPDIAAYIPNAAGAANLLLSLQGPLDALEIIANAKSNALALNGETINKLDAELRTSLAEISTQKGRATINGVYRGQPLNISSNIARNGDAVELDQLEAVVGRNRISGKLHLESAQPSGNLDMSIDDIASIASLAGIEASGNLTGNLRLDGDPSNLIANIQSANLETPQINIRNLAGTASLQNWQDGMENSKLETQLTAAQIAQGGQTLENIQLSTSGSMQQLEIDVRASHEGAPAVLSGVYAASGSQKTFQIKAFEASYRDTPITLAAGTTIQLAPKFSLPPLSLDVAGGTINTNGSLTDPTDFTADFTNLQLAQLERLAGTSLEAIGTASGTAKITGDLGNPTVNFAVSLTEANLRAAQQQGIEPFSAEFQGQFANQQLSLSSAALQNNQDLDMSASGNIYLANQQLDLQINGKFPIGLINTQLAAQQLTGEGAALLDMQITGAMSQPQINGNIRGEALSITDGRSGIRAKPIDLDIQLSGQNIQITTLTAPLSSGGRLSALGSISLDPATNMATNLEIILKNARLTDGEIVNTTIDGKLFLQGAMLADLTIAGELLLGETDVNIPEALPGNINNLDIRHVNASEQVHQQYSILKPPSKGERQSSIHLDMRINAPNKIFVRGRGMDVELGGKIQLKGDINNPKTVGGFTLRRGRLNFLEKRLDFTEGKISFVGSMTPILDFTAQRERSNATIYIKVEGPADDPQFIFSSEPQLPQDELIALLLFDRSYGNLSPMQILQLAQATAKLTGNEVGPDIAGGLREALDVDDVDIKIDAETGDAAVEIGKYLNDQTYVTVQQGSTPEQNKATIDIDIGRDFELHGEMDQAGERKIGIFYEKEY